MSYTSLRHRWRPVPPRYKLPAGLRPWLVDAGSLTARLRQRCERFSVRVLRQGPGTAFVDEAVRLQLRRGERVWVREVALLADYRPVVFARSVLPHDSVRGAWNVFHGMGERPLGALLFSEPRIRRDPLSFGCLDRRDARYHSALAATGECEWPAALWGRRSVFSLHGKPLLVTEIFLPGIFDLPA